MKSKRTWFLVVGASVILAVVAAFAQGGGRRGPGGFEHMLGFYSDYLDLTSAQQDQIKAIWQKEKPNLQPLMQQMRQFHSQLNQLTQDGSFDEAKVRALATQQSQTMIELAVQHARIKSEMMQVLTADQKAKFAAFQAKRAARFAQAPPGPPAN